LNGFKFADSFPAALNNLPALNILVLGLASFVSFPPDLSQLRNLTQLELADGGFLPTNPSAWRGLATIPTNFSITITSAPNVQFIQNMTNVVSLSVTSYLFNSITLPDNIDSLPNLRTLLISAPIATFPSTLGNLSFLDTLSLYCSPIGVCPSSFPPGVTYMPSLTSLTLFNAGISRLPNLATTFPNLEALLLYALPLNTAPDISGLSRLKSATFEQLSTGSPFPPLSAPVPNLVSLYIRQCGAWNWWPELQNCSKLNNLGFNQLTIPGSIPAWLGNLTSLESFSMLGVSSVTGSLPPSFANLISLRSLLINNVPGLSGELPVGPTGFVNLTTLDIEFTGISSIASLWEKSPLVQVCVFFLTRLCFVGS
jgi:hypothetical protein